MTVMAFLYTRQSISKHLSERLSDLSKLYQKDVIIDQTINWVYRDIGNQTNKSYKPERRSENILPTQDLNSRPLCYCPQTKPLSQADKQSFSAIM